MINLNFAILNDLFATNHPELLLLHLLAYFYNFYTLREDLIRLFAFSLPIQICELEHSPLTEVNLLRILVSSALFSIKLGLLDWTADQVGA